MSDEPTAVDYLLAELSTARPIVAAAQAFGAAERDRLEAWDRYRAQVDGAGGLLSDDSIMALDAAIGVRDAAADVLLAALAEETR
jgi:phosphoenolpyruvate carboxylase